MLVPRCLQLKAVAVTAPQLPEAIQTQGFCHTGENEAFLRRSDLRGDSRSAPTE
jgi:hypothetical protein